MVAILALISSILFTPAFTISYFYETGVGLICRGIRARFFTRRLLGPVPLICAR